MEAIEQPVFKNLWDLTVSICNQAQVPLAKQETYDGIREYLQVIEGTHKRVYGSDRLTLSGS